MADVKPKKPASKVFDVAKPGKSAPAASGRPVIVSSGPIMKDPMVTDGDNASAGSSSAPLLATARSRKVVVQPLSQTSADGDGETTPGAPEVPAENLLSDMPDLPIKSVDEVIEETVEETTETEAEVTVETTGSTEVTGAPPLAPLDDAAVAAELAPTAEEPVVNEDDSEPVEVSKPTETEQPAESAPADDEPAEILPLGDDTAVVESLSESDQKEALAAQKLAEEQEKIIESGAYYLPINSAHRKRSRHRLVLAVVMVIVLLALFALAAWDAELLNVPGYDAPTNYL